MSDQTDTGTDQVTELDATHEEAPEQTNEAPPWGDDFDPGRAWNTIQQQRESERQLKEQLAEKTRILTGEDEDGLRQFLDRLGYEIADEEDYEDYEDDDQPARQAAPPSDPRVDALIAREAERQFEADFAKAVGDRDVSPKARKWIEAQTVINGNDANALKAAVDEWFELTAPPTPKPKPKPPHVPNGGPPGTPPPAAGHTDRVQRALERMQAEQA